MINWSFIDRFEVLKVLSTLKKPKSWPNKPHQPPSIKAWKVNKISQNKINKVMNKIKGEKVSQVCLGNILIKWKISGEIIKNKMKENSLKNKKMRKERKENKKTKGGTGGEPLTLGSWGQPSSTWPSALWYQTRTSKD